ncbi:MAG: 16S rRNA (adenine(1518)-N(6)/adenine(1519)-N(6))-dimethyltransferase RsmA [Opitutales bacterium]
MPLNPTQTRERLTELGHAPRQPLGQNFLVDGNIVAKSLALAEVLPRDHVVEIGPGLGTLTEALLEAEAEVWAIEFDKNLHDALARSVETNVSGTGSGGAGRLYLSHGDALDEPLAKYPGKGPFKIVANLPYAIATPWLEAVLAGPLPKVMVLMLQKECAERFTASPGTKKMGAISVFLSHAYRRGPGHRVARQCFFPVPDVDSVLMHLERRPDARTFSEGARRLIRDFFTQRRKQIGSLARTRTSEHSWLPAWLECLPQFGASSATRPEALPLEAWWALEESRAAALQSL